MKRLILIAACIAATTSAMAQKECVKTAVNLTGNQATLTTSGAKSTTVRQNFVYYERKRLRKHDSVVTLPGIAAENPSVPLMLNSTEDVKPVQEMHAVSVSLPQNNVTACPDSAMNLTAMVNVESVASYTGNYPGTKTEPNYVKVSKRHYKMAARKVRKIERKQEKMARKADVNVEIKSTEA